MKCQKCQKSAVVHLTEIVRDEAGKPRQMHVHLCLTHAAALGLVPPGTELDVPPGNVETPAELTVIKPKAPTKPALPALPAGPTLPPKGLLAGHADSTPQPLVPARGAHNPQGVEANTCPVCGMTWALFRQHGLVGCPNDYTFFAPRLLPLIKRTQENADTHVGKVPAGPTYQAPARDVALARLQRDLQHAIETENYERAAKLRDELKTLG